MPNVPPFLSDGMNCIRRATARNSDIHDFTTVAEAGTVPDDDTCSGNPEDSIFQQRQRLIPLTLDERA